MEKNQMKNIVVLKNLPSNLVEEAILILKSNKRAKTFKYIDKKESVNQSRKNSKDYVIREAESVIANYINKTEKKIEKKTPITSNKYKMLRSYSIIITIILLISLLF